MRPTITVVLFPSSPALVAQRPVGWRHRNLNLIPARLAFSTGYPPGSIWRAGHLLAAAAEVRRASPRWSVRLQVPLSECSFPNALGVLFHPADLVGFAVGITTLRRFRIGG